MSFNPLDDPRFLLWKNVEIYIRLTPFDQINFDLLIERLKEIRERAAEQKEAV